jgi:hypothetical protein
VETGLTKQKEEISNIIKEYDAFIRKLIADKKHLSENCQKYCSSYEKTAQDFVVFKEKTLEINKEAFEEELQNHNIENGFFKKSFNFNIYFRKSDE